MKLFSVANGKAHLPPRILVYGTEGVGKSSLAATTPKPIFIQTEDGLGEIDCDRFPLAKTLEDVVAALTELETQPHDYSHLKRGAADDAPRSMRVDYSIGWRSHKSEWICFEHSGYARQRAVAWWKQRSRDPVPETTDEALARIEGGAIAQTLAIQVRSVSGEEYERIIDYELGPLPEPLEPQHFSNAFSDEEIPF